MARITEADFTDDKRAQMPGFAQDWIRWALNTEPLTESDRARVEDGIRRCYELAGLPWHGKVVWVSNPLIGACAAPISDQLLDDTVDGTVYGAVRDTVRDTVDGAVRGAVDGTVRDTVDGTVDDTVDDTVYDTVRGAVYDTVGDTVYDTVYDTVRGAVYGAVDDTVYDTVYDTVRGAVYGAVDGTVYGTVRGWSALSPTDAELVRQHGRAVRDGWHRYLSSWWSWWQSRNTFCIRVLGAAPEMAERVDAWEDACSAGMWWPYRDFVIVSVRPERVVHERVGPDGLGSHQLHCETGPALRWPDGWSIWLWHGVTVPQWVVESPTVDAIKAETNSEIRRCAIESYGWDRWLDHVGAVAIDECVDPGNPGHVLRLFETPEQVYEEPTRLLVMVNASRDRDGSRRSYAETVPASIGSAVEAAAWQFDIPVEVYRELERAT